MTALSDRELIELAAKAAGLHDLGEWREAEGCWYYPFRSPLTNMHLWNPLTDDGDALRLAVKLNLDVRNDSEACFVGRYMDEPTICEVVKSDSCAATRRAIVRAAAAIGQAQEASGVDAGAAGAQPSDAAK
jgi:hypothetical protein